MTEHLDPPGGLFPGSPTDDRFLRDVCRICGKRVTIVTAYPCKRKGAFCGCGWGHDV
jgi:hypothetical protein